MVREDPQLGARGTTEVVPHRLFLREGGEVQRPEPSGMLFLATPLCEPLGKGLAATNFAGAKRQRVALGGGKVVGALCGATPIALTRPSPERILQADVVVEARGQVRRQVRRLHSIEPESKPREGVTSE